MKTRKEEIKEFLDGMTEDEFLRSVEETEFDYYKNIKDPLFKVPRKEKEEEFDGIGIA